MKSWKLVLILSIFAIQGHAQDQLAIRLNEQGILKILKMAVQYNTATKEGRTIVIPENIYKFTIPKSQLDSNPVIPVLNEISDINMDHDLDFYFNTSDIKISGDVDAKSIKSQIFNSNENGFDLKLSLDLPKIEVKGTKLSLCEERKKGSKSCGTGLQMSLTKLQVTTKNKPVVLSVVLRLKTDRKVARISVISVESNLEGNGAPGLGINFESLDVPKISIVIDGQETELDTSRLKDELLKRKSYFAKKLLAFASEFVANDVAEMINVYLVNKTIATSYEVYRKDKPITFNEFLDINHGFAPADNTYLRNPFQISKRPEDSSDPMAAMLGQISEVIRNAQVQISLKRISTPGNKDVELAGLLNFVLNNKRISIRNTLGNTNRQLPKLDMTSQRNFDVNLALSEPLINGALDLANSTGLFQEIYESMANVPGFSIKNVKLHFSGNNAVVAVVNAQVDLNKISSSGVKSWFKNKIAAWLERNNNNAIIYFPIEVTVIPVFQPVKGGTSLQLKVLSPFNKTGLINRFKYPSNVPDMTETVKEGVMEELRESLEPNTNKTYDVDLSKFLNKSGVIFKPRAISINQGAYLMLNLDIADIKFNSLNPNQR